MNEMQQKVYDFHVATGGTGSIYTRKGQLLRARLIMEEAVETVAALGFDVHAQIYQNAVYESATLFEKGYAKLNLFDFIDGLCDLTYVVNGGAVNADIDLARHFDEVHAANMRKLTGPKRDDGKQLKPEGWVGPDHKRILELYTPPSEMVNYHPRETGKDLPDGCCRATGSTHCNCG